MARIPPSFSAKRLIDCNAQPDLLAHWPVAELVRASPTAQTLMSELLDWTLKGADLDGRGYAVDDENRIITVDNGGLAPSAIQRSRYFQNILTLRTFAALRAAWQDERRTDAQAMHRLDLWPLLDRIIAADIATMTLQMAWELRAEGDETIWRHALGDEYGDMAATYARVAREPHGLSQTFMQWFEKTPRVTRSDFEALAYMDSILAGLALDGRGQIGEGAIKCLTIDPLSGASYLGPLAGEIAGNPSWRNIADPVAEAHFLQIMDDIGATRVEYVVVRDKKLAARLFPDALINA